MKYKEIVNRLTGFSSPVFGINWNPPEPERKTAQRIINELGERRVLYNPSEMEMPHHCIVSIIQIRRFLEEELYNLDESSTLASSLRAMKAACTKFIGAIQSGKESSGHNLVSSQNTNCHFNSAIGELRGVFGIHIAQIAVQHGVDVESQLSIILPPVEASEIEPYA